MSRSAKCKVDGCENLCKRPNIYCGPCAGYEHEMPVAERQQFIRGRLLTVAVAGPVVKRQFKFSRRKRVTP